MYNTIVMFGGVRAAQSVEDNSSWIARAWTLQEAVESARRGIDSDRYALIEWPHDDSYQPIVGVIFHKLKDGLGIVLLRSLVKSLPQCTLFAIYGVRWQYKNVRS